MKGGWRIVNNYDNRGMSCGTLRMRMLDIESNRAKR
jgi:hypothetical protein